MWEVSISRKKYIHYLYFSCEIGNLKESGSGKSKKMAKRQAAHKMLQTLKSMPVERESEQSLAMIDEDDLAQGIGKNLWYI